MDFSEKLRLLMDIQGISASRLAKEIKVDASLVSRWRTGMRTPPQNSSHLTNIGSYFARSATMDYQKIALLEIMDAPYKLKSEPVESLAELIKNWLNQQQNTENDLGISRVLGSMQLFEKKATTNLPAPNFDLPTGTSQNIETFYGIEGIQKAAIKFLSMATMQDTPRTLLLFSDQDIRWLTEDRAFSAKWASLMISCLAKGNRIKIIHNLSRDLSEMFEAIEKWLPVYMTGQIEPYYCPKYHESLFKRTIFIAPDICAVESHIVAGKEETAEYTFTGNKTKIQQLAQFYNAYMEQCRPLMKIYANKSLQNLPKVALELEEQENDAFLLLPSFSLFSMEENLFQTILQRTTLSSPVKTELFTNFQKQQQVFFHNLKTYRHTEIIPPLTTVPNLHSNKHINTYPFMNMGELYYSLEEYCAHLRNVITLLKKFPNYIVKTLNYNAIPHIQVISKENIGVMFGKTNAPYSFFAVNQPNMCASFYTYLENISENSNHKTHDKKHFIELLQNHLQTYMEIE